MKLKYLLNIFINIFLIFYFIILINWSIIFFNKKKQSSLLYYQTIKESLENMPLLINSNDAFCKTHKGYNLETSCNSLTKSNCNLTSCCIFANGKCKAGNNKSGLLFNSNVNNKIM